MPRHSARRPLRWSLLVAALVIACVGLALPVAASAEAKLGISPLKVNLSGDAGDTLKTSVTLSAQGDEALSITFAHLDFGLTDDYGIVLINDAAEETTSFSTRNWFSVAKDRFRIPAGATVTVPVTIKIPPNTPGGTYLGIASFISSAANPGEGQIRTSVAAGTELFIAVNGGSPPKPRITKLDVPRFVTEGPIKPRLTITNGGDEYFALQGTVTIDGSRRGRAKIGEQYVLPDQPRIIQTTSTKDTDEERRRAALVVGTSSLGLGRHELEVRLRISPTNTTIVERRTFWVVPVWAWATLAALVLALLAGLAWTTHWAMRRMRSRGAATEATDAPSADPHAGEYDSLLGIDQADDTLPEEPLLDETPHGTGLLDDEHSND